MPLWTRYAFTKESYSSWMLLMAQEKKHSLPTFLLTKVRHHKDVALAVASSDIAATLLPGDRTAHSAFKLLLDLASTDTPVCNISKVLEWRSAQKMHIHSVGWMYNGSQRSIRSTKQNLAGYEGLSSSNGRCNSVTVRRLKPTLPVIPKCTIADEVTVWNHHHFGSVL